MVFQQVNHLVKIDSGSGISAKSCGDGMHYIFQCLDDRPLSVFLFSLDVLKPFSNSEKKMLMRCAEGENYCLGKEI